MASQPVSAPMRFLPVSNADAERMKPELRARLTEHRPLSASALTYALEAIVERRKVLDALGVVSDDAEAMTLAVLELEFALRAAEARETVLKVAA